MMRIWRLIVVAVTLAALAPGARADAASSSHSPLRWEMNGPLEFSGFSGTLYTDIRAGRLVLWAALDRHFYLALPGPLDARALRRLTVRMYSSAPAPAWEVVYHSPNGDWALGEGPAIVRGWATYRMDLREINWRVNQHSGTPGCEQWGGSSGVVNQLRLDPGNPGDRLVMVDQVALEGDEAAGFAPGVHAEARGEVELVSADFPRKVNPGDTIEVTLDLRVLAPPAGDATGFVYLVTPNGPVAQAEVAQLSRVGQETDPYAARTVPVGGGLRPAPRLTVGPLRLRVPRFAAGMRLEVWAGTHETDYAGRGDDIVGEIEVAASEPPKPVRAQVRMHHGAPAIFVNGQPGFAMAYLWGLLPRYFEEMAAAGIHVYNDPTPLGDEQEGVFDYTGVDAVFARILQADPDAYFIPRIGVTAPWWWPAKHPEELCLFADGARGPQSFASERWRRDSGDHLRRYIEHVRSSPFADRVLGFHICTGGTGEWQAWGLWDGQIGDYSEPMQQAFRRWVRKRYATERDLRDAWGDNNVTFDSVVIPTPEQRASADVGLFRDPARSRYASDFYEFYADVAADAILHFARVAREASHGESLVGFFYGYLTQHGPLEQDSHHLGLARVLASPEVDFLCSPAMYTGRGPGGTSTFMSAIASVKAHGKLWFDEADLRTYLAPKDDPFGRADTLDDSLATLTREFGHVLSHSTAMWWFDMTGGWFSEPHILAALKRMREIADRSMTMDRSSAAEIAVFVDDKSFFYCRPRGVLESPLIVEQVAALPRIGAPYDTYLLSDLARPDFPDYKLYVFLNAFAPSAAERRAIDEKVKRGGKVALWVYAPGFVGDDGLSLRGIQELTGIQAAMDNEEREQVISLDALAPLVAELGNATSGTTHRLAPRFFADDPDAAVAGRYADGKPALVIKRLSQEGLTVILGATKSLPRAERRDPLPPELPHRGFFTEFTPSAPEGFTMTSSMPGENLGVRSRSMDAWTSIYHAAPYVNPGVIRGAARLAGAHIYSDSGDALYANHQFVCLHANEGGRKTIRLPRPAEVVDCMTGEVLARAAREITLDLPQRRSVLLYYGRAQDGAERDSSLGSE